MFAKVKIVLVTLLVLIGALAAADCVDRSRPEDAALIALLAVLGSVSIIFA